MVTNIIVYNYNRPVLFLFAFRKKFIVRKNNTFIISKINITLFKYPFINTRSFKTLI